MQDFLRLKEEKSSGKIAQEKGQIPVELMLENGKPYRYTGALQFSDPAVDKVTGSVTLRAIFPNPDGEILPGMYVTALLVEGRQQNVLMVPQQGVTHNEQGKATALILDQKNRVQLREINAVKAVGNQWLVTAGLRPGDRVIVSGLQRIRPGMKARVLSSPSNSPDTVTEQ
ncbi:Multidrug resistance protein MdtE precursor [compost metagenome]